MKTLPLVAVILLNWNRLEETLCCLESLRKLSITGFRLEVIVVDNGSTTLTTGGSTDPTKAIRRSFRGATVLRLPENLGFTGGNNAGIKFALESGADSVWLLNNDTRPAPDCLRQLVQAISNFQFPISKQALSSKPQHSNLGIVSPVIYELGNGGQKTRRVQYGGGAIDWLRGTGRAEREISNIKYQISNDRPLLTEFIPGTAMLIHKTVFRRIGYLDEAYFAYNEDTDFCLRAGQAGLRLGLVSRARIWHRLAGSSGVKSRLFWYLNCRNKWLFMRQHAKPTHWPLFLIHYLWKPLGWRLFALLVHPTRENAQALQGALLGTKDGLASRSGRPPARLLA